MQSFTIKAPAKINLALTVSNKRPDGFHDIWSVMQAVSLSDTLRVFVSGASAGDVLEVTGPEAQEIVADASDNLVLQAVDALRAAGHSIPALQIELDKQIPVGAGLGGGSSDAAAILKGLNKACKLNLTTAQLAEIGAQLGSDVPFFFTSGSAEVTGRGEICESVVLPLDYQIALIIPDIRVPTGPAYRLLNREVRGENQLTSSLTTNKPALNFSGSQRGEGSSRDLFTQLEERGNDFESKFLEYKNLDSPDVGFDVRELASTLSKIDVGLRRNGAAFVRLSGSGSAVFGIFFSPITGDRLTPLLRRSWTAHLCRPIALADGPGSV